MAGTFCRADIFLTYCTNALAAQKENPDQQIVTLPDNLAVGADYGLTVLNGVSTAAQRLADSSFHRKVRRFWRSTVSHRDRINSRESS
jgi:hypothetical protein